MPIQIVKPSKKDISTMAELLGLLFEQEEEFSPDKSLQTKALTKIVQNPDWGTILIAKRDKEIIGMTLLLYTISTALGGKVAILEDTIVKSDERGKGIGQKLIEEAKLQAKADGCKRLTLLTDGKNTLAHQFYEDAGFSRSEMIPFRLSF